MNRITPFTRKGDDFVSRLWFNCPGCKSVHQVGWTPHKLSNGASWNFNGDFAKPTLEPSVLVTWEDERGKQVCHSFVRDGHIQFLSDCTHSLAGQTVELPEGPTI